MARFVPCQGKTACRDDGKRCLTCGRSLAEIQQLRVLLDQLATLAMEFDYQNSEEFSAYVAKKLTKTLQYRQLEKAS